jgi:SAM-dependent methyltransferase
MWEAMLDAAGVEQGTRFFDAGCGGGGASVQAAARGARICGLDAAAALVAIARERLPSGDFRVGDLEALPYGEQRFDAIIAACSVQYCADPIGALLELRRVAAPGGLLTVSTWGLPEHCEQRVVFSAVRAALPSPPDGEGPFVLSGAGALEQLVEAAGWMVIGVGEAECPFEYDDLETHWLAQRSGGPVQAAIRAVDENRLHEAIDRAVEEYRTSDGRVRLENRFRFVTASR